MSLLCTLMSSSMSVRTPRSYVHVLCQWVYCVLKYLDDGAFQMLNKIFFAAKISKHAYSLPEVVFSRYMISSDLVRAVCN